MQYLYALHSTRQQCSGSCERVVRLANQTRSYYCCAHPFRAHSTPVLVSKVMVYFVLGRVSITYVQFFELTMILIFEP